MSLNKQLGDLDGGDYDEMLENERSRKMSPILE
jgi:hypothetical protein